METPQKQNQSVGLVPSTERVNELAKILYQLNMLIAYPLSDSQIIEWALCLLRLIPNIDGVELQVIIDKMIIGEIEYDTKKGIKNIVIALKPNTIKSNIHFGHK